jgi:hypothetical protein
MLKKFEKTLISINELSLWDENARFPDEYFNKTEEELISYFFSSEKKYKMKQLAESIVQDFDLPQLENIVVYNYDEKLIVLEGNRRLSVYKSLVSPNKTKKKDLQKFFNDLKIKIDIDENYKLECLVTSDREQGLRFIDRKHTQRNNEVAWGDTERAHHNARRGKAKKKEHFRIEISKIVRNLDIPYEFKNDILGKGNVTTFFRILDNNAAWDKYGFELYEDGKFVFNREGFIDELKVIILNVLQKKDFNGKPVNSRTLNKNKEIEKYIGNIQKKDAKKVDEEIGKNTEHNLFEEETINISQDSMSASSRQRSKPQPTGFFYSSNVPYRIGNSSLRILYSELKEIEIAKFPNASIDLLRSFLECSLLFYFKSIDEFEHIQKDEKHNPTLGEMLAHIINGKCEKIDDNNLIEMIKQIKTDFGKPYSLERLNMINHNEHWVANENEARSTWAKLEPLFKIILGS